MRKRAVGRMMGHKYSHQPLREVMPTAEANPWLWFAWDESGDLAVAGVETERDLRAALRSIRRSRVEEAASALRSMEGPTSVALRNILTGGGK